MDKQNQKWLLMHVAPSLFHALSSSLQAYLKFIVVSPWRPYLCLICVRVPSCDGISWAHFSLVRCFWQPYFKWQAASYLGVLHQASLLVSLISSCCCFSACALIMSWAARGWPSKAEHLLLSPWRARLPTMNTRGSRHSRK